MNSSQFYTAMTRFTRLYIPLTYCKQFYTPLFTYVSLALVWSWIHAIVHVALQPILHVASTEDGVHLQLASTKFCTLLLLPGVLITWQSRNMTVECRVEKRKLRTNLSDTAIIKNVPNNMLSRLKHPLLSFLEASLLLE
ncbi:uncharacterized protein LOC118761780 [Octopus sinensis]|uniref:Uncharacterized protein LOC118761780 n=1 Tax=Octopus sinensis TaxID=2607531 RepID=A0A7E6ELI2_9MOLL|nr:uncharacterized protein LOC118761780 [Octopus sinensis]